MFTVTQIKTLGFVKSWYVFILAPIALPLPLFYLTSSLVADDPEAIRRVMAGTLVFGVAFSSGTLVGQYFVSERFMGNLKLIITMPVSKAAYVFGSLLYSCMMGCVAVAALFGFALAARVDMSVTWTVAPALLLAVLSMTGLTLFIVSFAPSLPVGNILAGFLGMVLALISPVYFSMEQAPLLLRWLGYASPMTYATDGITSSLSGHTDVIMETMVLAGFGLGTMALGLWRLPWREK